MQKYHYLLLTSVWLLGIFLINPIGEFPLNDDWVYAYPVYFLRAGLPFHFIDIQSMTLLSQIIWGWLFTLPFGFSFTALRIASLVAGWIGILTTYKLVKDTYLQPVLAFWTALALAVNPLYFSLAFTFMTDVSFTAWSMLAFWFYFQFLKQERLRWLGFAALFSGIAVLNRQSGLFMPLAFCVCYGCNVLTKLPMSFLIFFRKIGFALFPLAFTIGSLMIFNYWIDTAAIRPSFLRDISHVRWEMLLTHTHIRGGLPILYLGFFLLPFSIIHLRAHWWNLTLQKRLLVLGLTVIFAWVFFKDNLTGFPVGNIIYNAGIGPLTTFDALLLNTNNYNNVISNYWIWVIRIMMLLGGTLLFFNFFSNLLSIVKWNELSYIKQVQLFAMLGVAAYLPLLIVSETYFDRYFIAIFPLIILGMLPARPPKLKLWKTLVLLIFIAIQFVFSLVGTRDYFQWNRLRWQAAKELETAGIERQKIDGGYEYNGWYFGDVDVEQKEWFWIWGNDYLITFGQVPNYEIFKTYTYQRYLPYKKEVIYVLKKHELMN